MSTATDKPLNGISVFLSASIPESLEHSLRGQDLFPAVTLFTEHILDAGGKVVLGGHPTITPLVKKAVESLELDGHEVIQLHQLRRFKEDASEYEAFTDIQWSGSENGDDAMEVELQVMREALVKDAQAAIFMVEKLKITEEASQESAMSISVF